MGSLYQTRARARGDRRGFSLLEAMIASAVLGFGLIALVRLQATTVNGVLSGRQVATAMRIADQRAELLTTQRADESLLPACPAGSGVVGCREDARALSTPKTCTTWVDGPDIPSPTGQSEATTRAYEGYRMDVVIGAHPDATNQAGGILATVSVCWLDDRGEVREVQSHRLLVPGT